MIPIETVGFSHTFTIMDFIIILVTELVFGCILWYIQRVDARDATIVESCNDNPESRLSESPISGIIQMAIVNCILVVVQIIFCLISERSVDEHVSLALRIIMGINHYFSLILLATYIYAIIQIIPLIKQCIHTLRKCVPKSLMDRTLRDMRLGKFYDEETQKVALVSTVMIHTIHITISLLVIILVEAIYEVLVWLMYGYLL